MTDEAKKTKPEQYLEAANMLRKRAALSTIPHEKAQISAIASAAENMAKLRYSQQQKARNGTAIEAAIAKARASRTREVVEAPGGAETAPPANADA